MINVNAITVSVDYGDLLAITLPYTRKHFNRFMVVTSPTDHETLEVAIEHECETYVTREFYEDGADFNKFKALESGLSQMGREGWICLLDADIVLPNLKWRNDVYNENKLYSPYRRMWNGYKGFPKSASNWNNHNCPLDVIHRNNPNHFSGYFQLFHARCPYLGPAPWHETNWKHAGGGDTIFQEKWPVVMRQRMDFSVLHLGDPRTNWCGRATHKVNGDPIPKAEERKQALREYMKSRRHAYMRPNEDDIFSYEKIQDNERD